MLATLIAVVWGLGCVPALEIDAGTVPALRVQLPADARFSVVTWHSMYDAPLTEEFVVAADRQIHLTTVRSEHGGVLEYLGIDAAGPEHKLDRLIPSLSFLVATHVPQTLQVGDRHWSFREFGGPGDRLVFTPHLDCPAK